MPKPVILAVDDEPEVLELIGRDLRQVDRVMVRIVDDGPGIPGDVLPLIFDPFFTTKPPGQGTGLGLDVTRRLLHGFRGDISVVSAPGATEFRVGLAISDEGAGART